MSSVTLRVDSKSVINWAKNAGTGIRALTSKREVNRKAASAVAKWTRANFIKQGKGTDSQAEDGYEWEDLAEVTKKIRRHQNPGRHIKILRETGRLYNSIKVSSSDKSGSVRVSAPYADIHENGADNVMISRSGKKPYPIRVPQRKILPDNDRVKRIILPVYEAYIAKHGGKLVNKR